MDATVTDALASAAERSQRGYTFLDDRMGADEWSFQRIYEEAGRRGAILQSLGLQKGDRVGLILPDSRDFVLTFLGALRAGIVPVPMYPPMALNRMDHFLDTAAGILKTAGAPVVITSRPVSRIIWSLASKVPSLRDIVPIERFSEMTPPPLAEPEILPDDTCFLQFTSGSTSDPKGVVVTHGNLAANARAIMFEGLRADPEVDVGISWLPLYHDMGLIGFVIAPLFADVPVVFIPTLSFVKRPNVWMQAVHRHRGTISFAPNFAFGLASKRFRATEGLDLSSLRVLGCGAEPINARTIREFVDTFAPHGLRPECVMPAYGMAEATLAISFDSFERPFETRRIDRDQYEAKHKAVASESEDALELVACGSTFAHHEVGVMSDSGRLLDEGMVGELVFRGPSVTTGYFQNPLATASLHRDGWLRTGDLGFILDGRVFVSGRQKDLIILNGRNYYPQAIEWIVEHVDGVRKGNAVAFAIAGRDSEDLVIAVESKEQDKEALAERICQKVKQELGLRVSDCVVLGPGGLPKTSSGKLQRRRTRTEYEAGRLARAKTRAMGTQASRIVIARHVTASAVAKARQRIRNAIPVAIQKARTSAVRRAPNQPQGR